MKLSLGLLAIFLSLSVFAGSVTTETKSFVYDGTQRSTELVLRSEMFHQECTERVIETTCNKKETVGYTTVCSGTSYPGPYYPDPYNRGPYYPRPGGAYSSTCYRAPIKRETTYPCSRIVCDNAHDVKDFDVEARVIVDVTNLSNESVSGETFNVTLSGDDLFFEAKGSKKFFILKKKEDIRPSVRGSIKIFDALYAVELVEAAPVIKALNVPSIELNKSLLKFKLGAVENLNNLVLSLKIVQNKIFASDKVILDRNLLASEVDLKTSGDESEATVDLSKLGVTLEDGKFSITVKASAKFDGGIMNRSQFNDLSASRTLIFKSR